MASSRGSDQYGGILIRGATGQLWFMRSDGKKPVPIDDEKLKGQLSRLAEIQPDGMFTFPLPATIKQGLEKSLGGVVPWGVIIWWAHRLTK